MHIDCNTIIIACSLLFLRHSTALPCTLSKAFLTRDGCCNQLRHVVAWGAMSTSPEGDSCCVLSSTALSLSPYRIVHVAGKYILAVVPQPHVGARSLGLNIMQKKSTTSSGPPKLCCACCTPRMARGRLRLYSSTCDNRTR